MNTKTLLSSLSLTAAAALFATTASAQFYADFETDTSNNWNVNISGQGRADFSFDYSTVGIPLSPNSKAGDSTRALKLEANWDKGVFGGLSVSPIGQSFTGDFVLKFDHWSNFVTSLVNSTMFSGGGIGTAGTTPQWAGGVHDSVFVGATGDGDTTLDYRIYAMANQNADLLVASADNTDPYYSQFGGVAAPEEQLALFPNQTGTTPSGAIGMAWHQWTIEKTGDTVNWYIDDLLIGTVENYSALGVGGTNILFNRYDSNAGASNDPLAHALNFTLIDNIMVIPEPSTYAAIFGGLALLGAIAYRSRKTRA